MSKCSIWHWATKKSANTLSQARTFLGRKIHSRHLPSAFYSNVQESWCHNNRQDEDKLSGYCDRKSLQCSTARIGLGQASTKHRKHKSQNSYLLGAFPISGGMTLKNYSGTFINNIWNILKSLCVHQLSFSLLSFELSLQLDATRISLIYRGLVSRCTFTSSGNSFSRLLAWSFKHINNK